LQNNLSINLLYNPQNPTAQNMKYFLIISFILLLILAFLIIHYAAPVVILQPPRVHAGIIPQQFGLKQENLSIQVAPNLDLKGYWIKSKIDTAKGVILFCHGVGGCKETYLGIAQKLANRGIESILLDSRAHGDSDGYFCTYGFYESQDISKIVDYIHHQNPTLSIGIWGNSMGGAIANLALAKDKRLKFGIIQSTFTDLEQIVFDYKKRILKGIGVRFLSDHILNRAGEIANFDPLQVKPIEAVRQIEQPVFLAHGDADKNISCKYGQQLFDNLKSKDKAFHLVKNGGHVGLLETGGITFETKIMDFIERQLVK